MDAATLEGVQLIVNSVLVPLVSTAIWYLRESVKGGSAVNDRLDGVDERLLHIERKLRIKPRSLRAPSGFR